ncbi:protein phosphatase 2C domain-containing protein [Pyxidicoccus parkwayensis]|uniref:Protein phosphatase 2C domain-containing protein n=1 Tax=Pyxidicoccus parkwayensis TaxID=2813578 RepID=A0ABX7NLR3_9BACT|nr:protein phosphatase 2C domain-containing protein [Pyxidicoccus parkwaysis]QSQ19578.1 protein phosphatase 2C domain-containing protein [Pyxidicoccus parkwaysis]
MSLPLYIQGHSDTGRQRQQNEDCFRVQQRADGSWVLVVCDGMGGHEAGEVASAVASQRILEVLASSSPAQPPRALYDALVEANRAVVETALARGTPGMGTTAVAAWVLGARCYVGWVGDSRLYQFRQGRLIERSRDHTRVEQMVQHGILTPEQAKQHPDAHVLLRALGGSAGVQQDFRPEVWNEPLELLAGDVVLLCSDGLYDLIEDTELYPLIERRDCLSAVDSLIREANARGGTDNITAVLLVAGQSDVPAAGASPTGVRRNTLPETPQVAASVASTEPSYAAVPQQAVQESASSFRRETSAETPQGAAPASSFRREMQPEASQGAASAPSSRGELLPQTPHGAVPAPSSRRETLPETPQMAAPAPSFRRETLPETPLVPVSAATLPTDSARVQPAAGSAGAPEEARKVSMMWAVGLAAGTLLVGGLLGWAFGRGPKTEGTGPGAAADSAPASGALVGTNVPSGSLATPPAVPPAPMVAVLAAPDAGSEDAGVVLAVDAGSSSAAMTGAVGADAGAGGIAADAGSSTEVTVGAPASAAPPAPKSKKKASPSKPPSSGTRASGSASEGKGT